MRKENLTHELMSIAKFISGSFAGVGIAFAVMESNTYLIITGVALCCYSLLIENERRRNK